MKVHSPIELEGVLRDAVKTAAPKARFVIDSVEAPPNTCGWVTITFELGELLVRMERDRAEIDLFVKGPSDDWHNLIRLHAFIARQKQTELAHVKSKEVFDPGYSEEGAILETVSALSTLYSEIKAVLASPSAYSEFVAFEKRCQVEERRSLVKCR